jgi:hypothetical protein
VWPGDRAALKAATTQGGKPAKSRPKHSHSWSAEDALWSLGKAVRAVDNPGPAAHLDGRFCKTSRHKKRSAGMIGKAVGRHSGASGRGRRDGFREIQPPPFSGFLCRARRLGRADFSEDVW